MLPPLASGSPAHQRAYTLIEIMIALTLGLLLIGAIVLTAVGTGTSGRRQDAQGQMTEDGQIALSILASQLRVAGFWLSNPLSSLDPQTMIRGCRDGFTNVNAAFGALLCNAGTGNDSIAIRYEGREPGGTPRDCLGNTAGDLADVAADNGTIDNRYYIATSPAGNPALYCRGNGGGTAQMLIDNVESLELRYGISAVRAAPTGPVVIDPPVYGGEVVQYVRADALSFTPTCSSAAPVATSWCAVTSVRVCIIVRSAPNASDTANTPFVNCDGDTVSINDRRIRRAMETTVSLRNRTSVATPP